MKRGFIIFLFGMVSIFSLNAQTIVKGSVKLKGNFEPIPDVTVNFEGTDISTTTNASGMFQFSQTVPFGEQYLRISKEGFTVERYPVVVNEGETLDIEMFLEYDLSAKSQDYIISLSDDDLNGEDDGFTDNVSGLLQSSRDVFLNAAAFDFSATFFRPRGLDNANGKVLINGIEMNKQSNGRPQWANWGGLNDVQRNQEFSRGIAPNEYNFGDLAGTNNIVMRASKYREGGRVSFASANRSYRGRLMASYSSGLTESGWAYSILASRRFGNEGYVDGTLYDSNSFFASIEKKINDQHSINFTSIYAQNRRGRSTAITEEVFRLKGRQYNPFWGEQDGEIRNSRTRDIEEPILMLNHYWNISEKTQLNTNIAYQFGKIGNTRIDNGGTRLETFQGQDTFIGGARNTDPTYYQNLPSFFLQDDNPTAFDYEQAFLAQQEFVNNGQFNWGNLYTANANFGNSVYVIQDDRTDDKQLSANVILNTELADNIIFNASVNYRNLKSENFAEVKDLLGGTGYLDVDFFNDDTAQATGIVETAQSDVRNPNRIALEGERYKYNYEIDANVVSGFAQAQFKYNKVDFYLAGNISKTDYQRNGLYENGYFVGNSFGKSDKVDFNNFGVKVGATYKFSGKHLFDFNAAHMTKAPSIRNTFANARQANMIINDVESEVISSIDASYIFRSSIVNARLTGYYTNFEDGIDTGFFFSEGNGSSLVQEVVSGIDRRNIGAELGVEAQVTPTIKLKAVASVGQFTFANNPDLTYYSQDFGTGRAVFGNGKTNLENYHVAGGPERAYQLGFEYRDPDFWNIGITANHFSNAYVDPSALKRSSAFVTDPDLIGEAQFEQGFQNNTDVFVIEGGEINDINPEVAKELLKQEQFDDYMLVNVIGGKSWKIGDYFVGFFATINNVFNQEYRTGGFEQSRRVDYRSQLEEQTNENGPIFGNRYFYGNGTTYYLNLYLRF